MKDYDKQLKNIDIQIQLLKKKKELIELERKLKQAPINPDAVN
jgi:hypothetical protein